MELTCLILGYLFGCFLTADLVARLKTGKWARDIGTKNPGMANIGSLFGAKYAFVVLLGDILKTLIPCLIAASIFPGYDRIIFLWVGCGVTIGHNAPFWTKFKGGKGVTTTCSTLIIYDPFWGTVACLIGFLVVLLTKYLCFGAPAIPLSYLAISIITNAEFTVIVLVLFLSVMMVDRHGPPMWRALHGNEPRVDLIARFKAHRS
ncbi:MAG: glycerol-3-phosphate acyltransferase [Eggerthellaceae bacterium]